MYAPSASEIVFTMLFYLSELILILVLLLLSSYYFQVDFCSQYLTFPIQKFHFL